MTLPYLPTTGCPAPDLRRPLAELPVAGAESGRYAPSPSREPRDRVRTRRPGRVTPGGGRVPPGSCLPARPVALRTLCAGAGRARPRPDGDQLPTDMVLEIKKPRNLTPCAGFRGCDELWTQWNATGTGHHGSSGWFPRGIRGLAARAIMTANPMIRSSVRPRSQGDDLEHVSRTRKWTLCKQPARKGSALTRWRDGSGFTGAPCVRRPGDVRRERCGSRTRSAPLAQGREACVLACRHGVAAHVGPDRMRPGARCLRRAR